MRFVCKLLLIFIIVWGMSFAKAVTQAGVLMKADEVHYDSTKDMITAVGNIFVEMDQYSLNADKIHYDVKKDIVFAEGNIRVVEEDGKIIYGQSAVFKDKFKRGIIKGIVAKLDEDSILASRSANRINSNRVILEKSVFTPCKISCGNKPIWQLSSGYTDVDYEKQKITYKNVFFEIYGVPVMYLPYFAHSTPSAEAQSGILGPEIKNDDLVIPFYFRAKPNLDFTISPRLSPKHTIVEAQMRHRVKSGQYEVNGSYGNPAFKKENNGDVTKKSKPGRYHVFAKGDFSTDRINYGFDFKRASDKAYLINYHNIYDSYLTSTIYANNVKKRNYFSLEGFYFQDLRANEDKLDNSADSLLKIPLIFPSIRTRHVYSLNEEESLLLNVSNNTIIYGEPNLQLARTSLELELMNNLISNNGHVFSFALANRGDVYWVDYIHSGGDTKVWSRNIPEIRTRWRYPLINTFGGKSSIMIEPTAMVVLGRKYEPRFSKFELVDAPKSELSENNIFNANSYSGIDVHDYGNRLSYGMNASLISEYLYVNAFLGQLKHKNNVSKKGSSDYFGSASIDILDNIGLFYRFRRTQNFNPVRDEIGINARSNDLTVNAMFTELHNISRYFAKEGFEPLKDRASQLSFDMNYKLTKNLSVGCESKLDLTSKPARVLVRSIRMTYLFDCVSISGTISDNFLHDSLRGVKKVRSKTFSFGLKVINM